MKSNARIYGQQSDSALVAASYEATAWLFYDQPGPRGEEFNGEALALYMEDTAKRFTFLFDRLVRRDTTLTEEEVKQMRNLLDAIVDANVVWQEMRETHIANTTSNP